MQRKKSIVRDKRSACKKRIETKRNKEQEIKPTEQKKAEGKNQEKLWTKKTNWNKKKRSSEKEGATVNTDSSDGTY